MARLIPQSRIVRLPEAVGEGGDVTDYFVRLKHGREEFGALLADAKPLPPPPESPPVAVRQRSRAEVNTVKSQVLLTDFARRYLEMRASGRNWIAHCPFHDDRQPSFVLYEESQRFYCFGCGASGDVIAFLMKVEKLSFPEALAYLRGLDRYE